MRLWGVSDIDPSESLQTLKAETLDTLDESQIRSQPSLRYRLR